MSEIVTFKAGGLVLQIGRPAIVAMPGKSVRARLTGMLFDNDKTFLLPSAIPGMKGLKKIYDQYAMLRVLVSGHADQKGGADYNVALSGERAKSVAAYLKDEVDRWLFWYESSRPPNRRWGSREDQHMLAALGFYEGPVNGVDDEKSRAAVGKFQETRGLSADGKAGPITRRALVSGYMKQPDTSLPPGATVETHGCGEYHPEVPGGPDAVDARNRRVEIFFFEGAVAPAPRADCPAGGCPEYPLWCSGASKNVDLSQALADLIVTVRDESGVPIAEARVELSGPAAAQGKTDATGVVRFEDLIQGKYLLAAERAGFDRSTAEVMVGSAAAGGIKEGAFEEKKPAEGAATTVVLTASVKYWEFPGLVLVGVSDTLTVTNPPRADPRYATLVAQVKTHLGFIAFLTNAEATAPGFTVATELAVWRFKRAAHRIFRKAQLAVPGVFFPAGKGEDVAPADVFHAPPEADLTAKNPRYDADAAREIKKVDEATAKELKKWFDKKWVRPIARFNRPALAHGVTAPNGLRLDIADRWEQRADIADKLGGSLWGPYGDSGVRVLSYTSPGSSPTSRHFFGLAVDISQHRTYLTFSNDCASLKCLENRPATSVKDAQAKKLFHRQYHIQAIDETGKAFTGVDPIFKHATTFWRIWCRVDAPRTVGKFSTVHVGKSFAEKAIEMLSYWNDEDQRAIKLSLYDFPEGDYFDLSALLEDENWFTRIQAHPNWTTPRARNTESTDPMKQDEPYKHTEWWHFSACQDGEIAFGNKKPFAYKHTVTVLDMADLVDISESTLISKGYAASLDGNTF
ncbi:MAG TPA: peptidoglycan-binding protein [Myxococcota bacterium]|nr:peptidoglycan-binding protein [Myxococcota bacterium]